MELLLKSGAAVDPVNFCGLTPSEVTQWDGLEKQEGQAAASAAVAGTIVQGTSNEAAPSGTASSADSSAITAEAGEGDAASSAEARGSLVCPKCARVYIYQFRSVTTQDKQRMQRKLNEVLWPRQIAAAPDWNLTL